MQQPLWDKFTDEELLAIDMEIVANVPPPMMAAFIPVCVPPTPQVRLHPF